MTSSPFVNFPPETLALVAESTLLAQTLGDYGQYSQDLLWAAVRCVGRGELSSATISPSVWRGIINAYTNINKSSPQSTDKIERAQATNGLLILRKLDLDFSQSITPAILLATLLKWNEFVNLPADGLRRLRVDPRSFHNDLLAGKEFRSAPDLRSRGTIQTGKAALYERACFNAAVLNEWLITRLSVERAMEDIGLALDNDRIEKNRVAWEKRIHRFGIKDYSFEGIRPWTSEAAPFFGVSVPEHPKSD